MSFFLWGTKQGVRRILVLFWKEAWFETQKSQVDICNLLCFSWPNDAPKSHVWCLKCFCKNSAMSINDFLQRSSRHCIFGIWASNTQTALRTSQQKPSDTANVLTTTCHLFLCSILWASKRHDFFHLHPRAGTTWTSFQTPKVFRRVHHREEENHSLHPRLFLILASNGRGDNRK